ncbi:mitochondrial enolase superfamily member 1 [Grus japonensis]|uniref:Mitochondrial enolase superfamily member 1 n=1 Tax=Grus japonensis TaxID=30415 RepID=A0ABC9WMC3_GRUJA
MKFNKGKDKVLHLGKKNLKHQYRMEDEHVEGIFAEKNLRSFHQCTLVAKAANGILGCIRQSAATRSRKVIPPIYSAPVEPPPECWVQFWAPLYKRDMDILPLR